jgi:hypothetical protein
MKHQTRNLLITGIALLIFGPVLGWVLSIAGFFHAEQSVMQTPPGVVPDIRNTASDMFASLIPICVGIICGAIGMFLILFALITHRFRSTEAEQTSHHDV